MVERYSLRIKDLPQSDRPRERLLEHGPRVLADSDLLAVILRTGNGKESAVGLAQRILSELGGIENLAVTDARELCRRFDGIGPAKAAEILSVFELGRRAAAGARPESPQIDSSRAAAGILAAKLRQLNHEEFWILMLNGRGRLIGDQRITQGAANHTVVEPMDVFRPAISRSAAAILLAHNHPNGDSEPSSDDVDLTERLAEAGRTLNIQVLDHLILVDGGYYSFADEGIMPSFQ